jgi:hypothetical protein
MGCASFLCRGIVFILPVYGELYPLIIEKAIQNEKKQDGLSSSKRAMVFAVKGDCSKGAPKSEQAIGQRK